MNPDADSAPEAARRTTPDIRRLGRWLLAHQELAPLIAIVVLFLVFEFRSGGIGFFTSFGLMGSVAALTSSVGLVALGITALMISGEFDLSVSGTFALGPAVMGWLLREWEWNIILCVFAGLLIVSMIGLINGVITTFVGVPSFIVTLGTLFAVTSWNRIILGGFPVTLTKEQKAGTTIDVLGADIPNIPVAAPFVWMLGFGIVLTVVMRRTQYGNWTYAAGSLGGGVARAMGVPVRRVKLINFVLAALLAGLAGILQFADFGSSSVASGDDMNLTAIVAVVIGGTSLFGAKGTVIGSILGALILGTLKIGLVVVKVPPEYYLGLVGVLLIFSAGLNARVEIIRRGGIKSTLFG